MSSNSGNWKHYNWWAHRCVRYATEGLTSWFGDDLKEKQPDYNITGDALVQSVHEY